MEREHDGILRIFTPAHDAAGVPEHAVGVAVEQRAEGSLVTVVDPCPQCPLVVAHTP